MPSMHAGWSGSATVRSGGVATPPRSAEVIVGRAFGPTRWRLEPTLTGRDCDPVTAFLSAGGPHLAFLNLAC
jgi:hypothetical protein